MSKALTEDDFRHAADLLGCSVAAIKAVAEVEAPNGGFNQNDTPTTLFEAHKFHLFTDGRFDEQHPNLSGPTWDKSKYGKTWLAERRRLAKAIALDREAALKSTSWGRFQLMGFNYELCGYEELEVFVADMHRAEKEQLMAFVAFLRNAGIDDELREHRWAAFAKRFNGPSYAVNKYDQRLAAAYEKFNSNGANGSHA